MPTHFLITDVQAKTSRFIIQTTRATGGIEAQLLFGREELRAQGLQACRVLRAGQGLLVLVQSGVPVSLFAVEPGQPLVIEDVVVDKPGPRPGALVGNVIWLVLCGWWLVLGHIATAIAQALTIVGIPLALANLKLIPVSLLPLGKQIVPVDQAQAEPAWPASSRRFARPER